MTQETNQEPVDLLPSNGQIDSKAYVYRLIPKDSTPFYITVIAPNTTTARVGLQQQHPDKVIAYIGVSEQIMQVN